MLLGEMSRSWSDSQVKSTKRKKSSQVWLLTFDANLFYVNSRQSVMATNGS